ncbi:MAG: hypothetical protein EG826_12860 [Deltaproteobacteria bacterium]|nr:hypothetical protein [Deltaproteobacteria bacterium]
MRNMNWKTLFSIALIISVVSVALASTPFLGQFNALYGTSATALNTCALCHPAGGGNNGGNLNSYANDFSANGNSFAAIEAMDSDGDGFTNIVEINARTFPGDPTSFPAGDTTPPTVTAFVIPATSASLTVPITTFTATDTVGVTGYLVTETATAPLPGAAGWTATPPANYTFATAGSKTLFAWAKDAAGNVSTSLSASVVITLTDTTPPTVTAFVIPATSASLIVPITTFTATDTVGVTGYIVTETATAPLPGAPGWTATPPVNYTFTTAGSKTLFAWAKDAAGNVSTSLSASVVITLADTTPPTVTAFVIPATSASLTVPITTFTATDTVGVTGYIVTETATAPLAGAAGWTATPPVNYIFATPGTKTLYAWAKDAAGNVSTSLSASVTITLNLAAPTNTAPANGSTVALTPVLQISVAFPDVNGGTHQSTNWQIATDASFAASSIVFSDMSDATHLTSLTVPPGILSAVRTYVWRASTVNSLAQTSPYSTSTSFTTQAVAMDAATGTVPDAQAVKINGAPVTNLATLTPAQLAAAGNISPQLVSGPNSVPLVNAGAGTDTTLPGMMIVKTNGGASQDVLGIVTPAGTIIESLSTTTTSDGAFGGAPIPPGINFPYGVVSFRLSGVTAGATLAITIYTPTDLPAGAIWNKFSPSRGWLKIDAAGIHDSTGALLSSNATFTVVGGRGILTILDNGLADFSTEVVGGRSVILDPGGPGIASTIGPSFGDGGNSGCFIATAAFGSAMNPYVGVLKKFRDRYLMTHAVGRLFVKTYYRVSPPIAETITSHPWLKYTVRLLLLPLIGFSLLALEVNLAAAVIASFFIILGAGLAGRKIYRFRRRSWVS